MVIWTYLQNILEIDFTILAACSNRKYRSKTCCIVQGVILFLQNCESQSLSKLQTWELKL